MMLYFAHHPLRVSMLRDVVNMKNIPFIPQPGMSSVLSLVNARYFRGSEKEHGDVGEKKKWMLHLNYVGRLKSKKSHFFRRLKSCNWRKKGSRKIWLGLSFVGLQHFVYFQPLILAFHFFIYIRLTNAVHNSSDHFVDKLIFHNFCNRLIKWSSTKRLLELWP